MLLTLLLVQVSPDAQPIDSMIANSRQQVMRGAGIGCLPAERPGDIVVCGKTAPAPMKRSPFEEREAPPDAPEGAALSGVAALNTVDRCMRLCHQPVGISLIGAARAIGKAADILLNGK